MNGRPGLRASFRAHAHVFRADAHEHAAACLGRPCHSAAAIDEVGYAGTDAEVVQGRAGGGREFRQAGANDAISLEPSYKRTVLARAAS